MDEDEEGQRRIKEMFVENQLDIKEGEKQSGDDSGKENVASDAGIWTVETLRRKLKIGTMKKGKIDVKRARREMLAAYIWNEEATRIEEENGGEQQRERRTKQTGAEQTEIEEKDREGREEEKATRTMWETRQASINAGKKTLEEMGFNGRAESSSRGERIRKKEEKHEINERQRRYNKRKRKELEEKLEEQIREWNRGETERDEITENASKVLREGGEATTELIRKVIRDGMDTEKTNTTEEIYKYDEYIILDACWGQYTEGTTDQTKTIFRGKEAYSGFQRIVKDHEKIIAIIHYAHHWSFTVIDTIEGKMQRYDSMVKAGHKEANETLKRSLEEIFTGKQQKEWVLEQMQIPQQTDKESCGYRMLYNINKICSKQNIEIIENEEMALEGYTLEIVKMLKGKQQNVVRREEERGGKKICREEEIAKENKKDKHELIRKKQETQENTIKRQEEEKKKLKTKEQEKEKEEQELKRKEQETLEKAIKKREEEKQELETKEQEMQDNINKKREEIERKRKVRNEEKEENEQKNKQRKTEGKEYESGKHLKRTRQQQKLENAEEKQEDSKLRSGKIRRTNLVERSLSSRCRDAPD